MRGRWKPLSQPVSARRKFKARSQYVRTDALLNLQTQAISGIYFDRDRISFRTLDKVDLFRQRQCFGIGPEIRSSIEKIRIIMANPVRDVFSVLPGRY
jgi:hypothetical protein